MSFAASLKNVPKKKSFIQAREQAMSNLIMDFEKSIKKLATEAAKTNSNNISGFLCEAPRNELKLEYRWEENINNAKNKFNRTSPILRVDRYLYREKGKSSEDTVQRFTYQSYCYVHYNENFNPDSGNDYHSMSETNIEELRSKLEKCICDLGFKKYEIKIVPKQFLFFYQTQTNTFFGKKDMILSKNGDLGKVVYVSISW